MTPTASLLRCCSVVHDMAGTRRNNQVLSRFKVYSAAWCMALMLLPLQLFASQKMPAVGTIELAFSPSDNPEALIVRVVDEARVSVHVHAYVFTSRTIANALIAAHRRGVRVEVLADAEMNKRGGRNTAIPALLAAGVPVAFETAYAAAHNKVLIVDPGRQGCTLLTGSYNFTWSAQNRNAENVIVLRDNCRLVDAYLRNWQHHRKDATLVHQLPWSR